MRQDSRWDNTWLSTCSGHVSSSSILIRRPTLSVRIVAAARERNDGDLHNLFCHYFFSYRRSHRSSATRAQGKHALGIQRRVSPWISDSKWEETREDIKPLHNHDSISYETWLHRAATVASEEKAADRRSYTALCLLIHYAEVSIQPRWSRPKEQCATTQDPSEEQIAAEEGHLGVPARATSGGSIMEAYWSSSVLSRTVTTCPSGTATTYILFKVLVVHVPIRKRKLALRSTEGQELRPTYTLNPSRLTVEKSTRQRYGQLLRKLDPTSAEKESVDESIPRYRTLFP